MPSSRQKKYVGTDETEAKRTVFLIFLQYGLGECSSSTDESDRSACNGKGKGKRAERDLVAL